MAKKSKKIVVPKKKPKLTASERKTLAGILAKARLIKAWDKIHPVSAG